MHASQVTLGPDAAVYLAHHPRGTDSARLKVTGTTNVQNARL